MEGKYTEGKETIVVDGISFRKRESGHMTATLPLHKYLWMKYHQACPLPMMHIHHVNSDKNDNSIENLMCLTPQQHSRIHREEEKKTLSGYFCVSTETDCPDCGQIFLASKGILLKWKKPRCPQCRKNMSDRHKVERICVVCGAHFICSRYGLTRSCSKKCTNELQRITKNTKKSIDTLLYGKGTLLPQLTYDTVSPII